MPTLTRYAIREFLKVFLLSLFGMTMFLLLIGVAREAMREGLGPGPILRLLPFIVPDSLRFSMPASALLASTVVFGRMAADNEIVAMKSLGISPSSIIFPVLVVGFVISLFTVWINDLAVSWGRAGMSRVVMESIEQIAYGMLRTQKAYATDRFSITVKAVEGQRLVRPLLTFHASGEDGGDVVVAAREARLQRAPGQNSLSLFLTDASIEGPGELEGAFNGTHENVIQLDNPRKDEKQASASDVALRSIPGQRVVQKQRIQRLEYGLAAEAAFQLMAGDFRGLADPEWEGHSRRLKRERYQLNRLRTEPWRRWANGFSCFFFVAMGTPWSIIRRNSDFVSSFFTCFIPIVLIYYPLMAFGVDRAKEGALPQYAVWLGNVVCLGIAILLIRRVSRY